MRFDPSRPRRPLDTRARPRTSRNWANPLDRPPFEAFAVTCGHHVHLWAAFGSIRSPGYWTRTARPFGRPVRGWRAGRGALLRQLPRRFRPDGRRGVRPNRRRRGRRDTMAEGIPGGDPRLWEIQFHSPRGRVALPDADEVVGCNSPLAGAVVFLGVLRQRRRGGAGRGAGRICSGPTRSSWSRRASGSGRGSDALIGPLRGDASRGLRSRQPALQGCARLRCRRRRRGRLRAALPDPVTATGATIPEDRVRSVRTRDRE